MTFLQFLYSHFIAIYKRHVKFSVFRMKTELLNITFMYSRAKNIHFECVNVIFDEVKIASVHKSCMQLVAKWVFCAHDVIVKLAYGSFHNFHIFCAKQAHLATSCINSYFEKLCRLATQEIRNLGVSVAKKLCQFVWKKTTRGQRSHL